MWKDRVVSMKIRLNTLKKIHRGKTLTFFFWIRYSQNNWRLRKKNQQKLEGFCMKTTLQV